MSLLFRLVICCLVCLESTFAFGAKFVSQNMDNASLQNEDPRRQTQPSQEIVRKLEFEQALNNVLPLTPDELEFAQQRQDQVLDAVTPVPAQMHTETRKISITPGNAPQIIHLTQGYTSTLIFQDITGRPWPVLAIVLGNAKAFSALQPHLKKAINGQDQENKAVELAKQSNVTSNVINIVPLEERGSSNVAVTLENCPYPIILHLITASPIKGKRTSDALIVFRLDHPGPNATLPNLGPVFQSKTVADETLSFIHAIQPQGAKRLVVEPAGLNIKVWKYADRLYLRTNYALIWPAWTQVAQGEDMRVYVLPKTNSIVVAVDGKYTKLHVQGGKD